MFTESVTIKGNLEVALYDESGAIKDSRKVNNLVVAVGKDLIASRLVGNSLPIPSHMALGASSTAASTSQTALGSELGRVSLDSTARTSNTVSYVATFPAGTGTGTVQEAGIFNDGTTGNMLCRTTFSAVNKAVGDTVVVTWNVTVA
jgi:hypothetical protein